MERCGAKKATILGAGRFEIQNENTSRVKWIVRRKAACSAGWRRMGKKNFTRVRVKFKTRRGGDSNPRYPFEAHSISNRARSTNSVTSPSIFFVFCKSIYTDFTKNFRALLHNTKRMQQKTIFSAEFYRTKSPIRSNMRCGIEHQLPQQDIGIL